MQKIKEGLDNIKLMGLWPYFKYGAIVTLVLCVVTTFVPDMPLGHAIGYLSSAYWTAMSLAMLLSTQVIEPGPVLLTKACTLTGSLMLVALMFAQIVNFARSLTFHFPTDAVVMMVFLLVTCAWHVMLRKKYKKFYDWRDEN